MDNSILLNEGADNHREVNDICCLEDIDSVSIWSWCTGSLLVLDSSLGGEYLHRGDSSVRGGRGSSGNSDYLSWSIVNHNSHT